MDYTEVTEVPGIRLTREALDMMFTRYAFAGELCSGKEVLEVGCGAGQGLGYIASRARRTVGGDWTERLLSQARRHYGAGMTLVRLDAHNLPFSPRSFDVILLYEAIYYLREPELFLEECRRVLRAGGTVLISTVNREWCDFNPSPLSTHYLSAEELSSLLEKHGFRTELRGAFPAGGASVRDHAVSCLKRAAVSLHLVPRTMKGKELLKRIFLGELLSMPPEVPPAAADSRLPEPISIGAGSSQFKVLFAIGRLP